MERPFDLLQQVADVVEGQAGTELAEIARDDVKRLTHAGRRARYEASTQGLVHNRAKRTSRSTGFGHELRRDVLIECQRSPHALMLMPRHHDVNVRRGHMFTT